MVISVGKPDSATRKYIVEVLAKRDSKYANDISYSAVDGVVSKKFNFEQQTQDIIVKLNGIALEEDVDYDVIYSSNIEPGTAHMKLVGKGKYSGTKDIEFQILEDKFDISESDPYFN